jgi:hypothetical protein
MASTKPIRIFVSISPKSSLHDAAWESPDTIIQAALDLVRKHDLVAGAPAPRLLAKERWHRIHIVFDIFNDDYEPDKAHLSGQNDLPVIAVYLSDQERAGIANNALAKRVNEEIRNFHDWTGIGSQAPFTIDHANGNIPTYPNPRSLVKV